MKTNDRMATWYGVRIVRSKKRARYLQKRGENIAYAKVEKCWVWRPFLGWEERFVCPNCGGNHFGTSGDYITKEQTGRCHDQFGIGCRFNWLRNNDDIAFRQVRRPMPKWVSHSPIPVIESLKHAA